MKSLPLYIPVVFIATTFLTLYFLYKGSRSSKAILVGSLIWLALQAAIGLSGFYEVADTLPPRFLLLILPPFLLVTLCFVTNKGRAFVDRMDTKWLTVLHAVRIPVELVLFWLFLQKLVPELMTFEGRNPDILSGLTAPLVYYFGYYRNKMNRKLLLAWNFICVGLLANIVFNAMLSAPFAFQQFAFEQPNIGVLYFPFVWLPGFIVPAVLFSHLVSIRALLMSQHAPSSAAQPTTTLSASY